MTSPSELTPVVGNDLEDYGLARARDAAFDAVYQLWKRRHAEGMKQKDIADRLGRNRGWVSRNLRGPGNWTMRTLGAFVEALNGELEIHVFAKEDPIGDRKNSNAYSGYEPKLPGRPVVVDPAGQTRAEEDSVQLLNWLAISPTNYIGAKAQS